MAGQRLVRVDICSSTCGGMCSGVVVEEVVYEATYYNGGICGTTRSGLVVYVVVCVVNGMYVMV